MARDESNAPGSANDGGQGNDGWSADGSLPDDLQIKTPADSADAMPIKGKESEEKPETEPEEGQESEPEEAVEKTAEKEEPEEEPESSAKDGSLTEIQGKLTQMEKMLQFYQQGYNELLQRTGAAQQPQQPPVGEQAAKGKPTQPGPAEGDFEPPPAEWKTTQDVVQYFDKRNQSMIKREIDGVVRQYVGEIDKSFARVNQAIHSFIDRSVKPQLEDFDDVIKNVNNEVFVLDPTGQNVVDVRNRALLQYFQAQPIPILAMYDYGLSKRAPQKIKQAASEATKKTVQKIAQKPKAPKQIKGGASSEEVGELDWNTPKDRVEQILGKKRLI